MHGVQLVRALCPPSPDDVEAPLPFVAGPLDGISDGLRDVNFDAYVAAARDVLTGKARRRLVPANAAVFGHPEKW